ncbi:MAG: tRNA glutamyl-Q(34) synthetase GluQRS [bacterium]|nr:tRNA glutamyl-Q(34) synthetase GluQRS [bacterium]
MGDRVTIAGRLAPSPTGLLHLGHARSFLLAWWHARSRGGKVLLRMEDLDAPRVKPGMADAALFDLEWLGLDWDGEVVWQSRRTELYEQALSRLEARDLVYPCICTRREIAEAQSAPHADAARYPGTCRGRFRSIADARAQSGREPALRLHVAPGELEFKDALHGRIVEDVARTVGDFPVATRSGAAAYQLAVVVDDAQQGVTEVVRGDDLLPSTARQALLQELLSLPHPSWLHVPLVQDANGRRLAKRADDVSLAQLRESGLDPGEVVAWAARASAQPGPERGLAGDYLDSFDLALLPLSPVRLASSPFAR